MAGRLQHGRIEQGVAAQQALVRQAEVGVGRLDHQDGGGLARAPAATWSRAAGRGSRRPGRSGGRSRRRGRPRPGGRTAAGRRRRCGPAPAWRWPASRSGSRRRGCSSTLPAAQGLGSAAFRRVEVEGAGPQRALEIHPAGRRALVVDEGGRAEEALLGDLPLIGAGRHVGVGLAGVVALRAADRDPVSGRPSGFVLVDRHLQRAGRRRCGRGTCPRC